MAGAPELQQGTLELLILKTLVQGPLHGWGIAADIRRVSRDVLQVGQGSLYPALYRLEDKELIEAEWGISDEGRRAKFYRLTAAGRKTLAAERAAWKVYSAAVNLVLSS